jgi:hypothetical protein
MKSRKVLQRNNAIMANTIMADNFQERKVYRLFSRNGEILHQGDFWFNSISWKNSGDIFLRGELIKKNALLTVIDNGSLFVNINFNPDYKFCEAIGGKVTAKYFCYHDIVLEKIF